MLLVGQVTWISSACVQLRHMLFLSPYNVESTGRMGGIKVFAGPGEIFLPDLNPETDVKFLIVELPERQTLIERKHDVLARFLHILNPLVEVFRIPRPCLHVFADSEGQLVAFNRSGSLFMNLRYFEAWRTFQFLPPTLDLSLVLLDDRDVQQGDYTKAMISWFVFSSFPVHLLIPFP
jgi:hypothetical protein